MPRRFNVAGAVLAPMLLVACATDHALTPLPADHPANPAAAAAPLTLAASPADPLPPSDTPAKPTSMPMRMNNDVMDHTHMRHSMDDTDMPMDVRMNMDANSQKGDEHEHH